MRINPEVLRSSARVLEDAGWGVADDVSVLDGALRGVGSPWGGDELGSVFGAAYLGLTEVALDAFRTLGQRLDETGQALLTVADGVEEVDAASAAAVDAVNAELW